MLLPPAGVEQDLSLLQCPQRRGMGLSSCWVSLQLLSITTGRSFNEEKKNSLYFMANFYFGYRKCRKKRETQNLSLSITWFRIASRFGGAGGSGGQKEEEQPAVSVPGAPSLRVSLSETRWDLVAYGSGVSEHPWVLWRGPSLFTRANLISIHD